MTVIEPGRYFMISETGRALEGAANVTTRDGSTVQTWKRYYGLNQVWEIKEGVPGCYELLNVAGQNLLSAPAGGPAQPGNVLTLRRQAPGDRNQMWQFRPLADGRYAIRCAGGDSRTVLKLRGNVIDRSAVAELGLLSEGDLSQRWRLVASVDQAIVEADAVDLRPNQTPIKSQGGRLTCTYFGVTAALEAAYKKAGHGDINLSEEFWSVMSKALELHATWDHIRHANYRENQFAGTGGGGTIKWYARGFRVPTESDVPYRPENYIPDNWDTRDQRITNDYNFSHFTRNALRARRYYGAAGVGEIAPNDLRNAEAYENLLRLGFEIVLNLRDRPYGDHQVLVVGFDRSTPDGPVFLIKNSWGPQGADPRHYCDIVPYSEILPNVVDAGYITDPATPAPWPELAFLGRWQLNFDGHHGMLDIYHIPGVSLLETQVPGMQDRRIGVFYDPSGKAHRVNGSISGHSITFHFSGAKPNLRWDQIEGRKFTYFLNPDAGIMAGFHVDSDPNIRFAGVATKGDAIRHNVPQWVGFAGLAGNRWSVVWGGTQGVAEFGRGSSSSVRGTINLSDRTSKVIEATTGGTGDIVFRIEGSTARATARALNHAPGLIAGHGSDSQPFCAAYMAPVLARIGSGFRLDSIPMWAEIPRPPVGRSLEPVPTLE